MNANITLAQEWIAQADAILIGASNGLSIAEGYHIFANNEMFRRQFGDMQQQYGFRNIVEGLYFQYPTAEARLEFHRRLVKFWVEDYQPSQVMHNLMKVIGQKDYFILTSNGDLHLEKSGFDEKRMYECHGSIHFLQCVRACRGEYWSADEFTPVVDEKNCLLLNEKPHCPVCGSLARPNIKMYDDTFWLPWRSEFQSIRMRDWLELDRKTVVIELGAGTAIPTVRAFSERLTRKNQASLIRINTTEAKVGREQDVGIEAGALDALRAIDALLKRTAI